MSFAVPGKILEEYMVRNNRLGLVEFRGAGFGEIQRPVFLDLVPEAHVGDYVLVHVGFATKRVPPDEAIRAYEQLGASDAVEASLETARWQKPN
jgi:hydrogenase expression/formation protein HypC